MAVLATVGLLTLAAVAVSAALGRHGAPRIAFGVAPTPMSAPSTPAPTLSELGPASRPPAVDARPVVAIGTSGASVPVLMYHYIRVDGNACDRTGQALSVSPANFNAQLDLLDASGFHVITLDRLMTAVLSGGTLPSRPVVLTFDDGYADFATAAVPILLAHGMTATDFVVPGFLGRLGYMTSEQVLQVQAAGMTIGAHTMHHVALAHVTPAVAALEISQSRTALQALTGTSVPDFAYPYGDTDTVVESLVAASGFREAFTTIPGARETVASRLVLPRVRANDGTAAFAAELGISTEARTLAAAHPTPMPPGVPNAAGVAPPASACGVPRPTAPPAAPAAILPTVGTGPRLHSL